MTSEQPPSVGNGAAPSGPPPSVAAPSPGAAAPAPAPRIAGPEHVSDPRVEDALSRLRELDDLPLAEQIAVFGDIHHRLEAVLADPDSRA